MRYYIEDVWITKAGYPAVVILNDIGYRCGFVAVDPEHKLYGSEIEKVYEYIPDLNVHGGLIYSGESGCPIETIEDLWWFGFDCAHYGDLPDVESLKKYFKECGVLKDKEKLLKVLEDFCEAPVIRCSSSVRSRWYVKQECEKLANYLKTAERSNPIRFKFERYKIDSELLSGEDGEIRVVQDLEHPETICWKVNLRGFVVKLFYKIKGELPKPYTSLVFAKVTLGFVLRTYEDMKERLKEILLKEAPKEHLEEYLEAYEHMPSEEKIYCEWKANELKQITKNVEKWVKKYLDGEVPLSENLNRFFDEDITPSVFYFL